MSNGVFSLLEVRAEQVKNIANGNFASWSEGATYGYFAGGQPPATGISSIDRLDFFTEVLSSPGTPLGRSTNEFDGFSSSLYGYFGGGDTPTTASDTRVDRLDFSTETISNPGNNLNPGRQALSATSSTSYGYFGGGATPTLINTITRLDFSNETISDPGKNLPTAISSLAATESSSYGYFGGGATPTIINTITRLDFSNETISNSNNNLPSVRSLLTAISSNSYGYFIGGTPDANGQSIITRLDFSNETIVNSSKTLNKRNSLQSVSNNFNGYIAGGLSGAPEISTITRLDFSNENLSDITSVLSIAKNSMGALSGGQSTLRGKGFKTYGYFGGGNTGTYNIETYISSITRFDFSSDVLTSLSQNLNTTAASYLTDISSNYYGYFAGGESPAATPVSVSYTTRFDFSNEITNNTNITTLPSARTKFAATSSNSYGYFGGGRTSPTTIVNTISRFEFSNETASLPNNNLSSSRVGLQAFSSNSYGYFIGGAPGPSSLVSRLDFTNESISNPTTSPAIQTEQAAFSNTSYAYFAGGTSNNGEGNSGVTRNSNIWRLDFSNESISLLTAKLSDFIRYSSGFNSNNFGYYIGGETQGAPFGAGTSYINRLDFSTESRANPGTLPTTLFGTATMSNSN